MDRLGHVGSVLQRHPETVGQRPRFVKPDMRGKGIKMGLPGVVGVREEVDVRENVELTGSRRDELV